MKITARVFASILIAFIMYCWAGVAIAGNNDVAFTAEQITNMSPSTRNVLFEEIKKQAELEKENRAKQEAAKVKVDEKTITQLSEMDVASFQAKLTIVADAVNAFCQKLGVTVNEFIKTPVGTLAVFGIVYKMGIFASLWSVFKSSLVIIFFLFIIYQFNTKKKVIIETHNTKNEVIGTETVLVPKFTPITDGDKEAESVVAVIATIICAIIIVVAFIYM
jgi:hypothetical protein